MSDDGDRTPVGVHVMFWLWATVIAVGLAIMIVLPLQGR